MYSRPLNPTVQVRVLSWALKPQEVPCHHGCPSSAFWSPAPLAASACSLLEVSSNHRIHRLPPPVYYFAALFTSICSLAPPAAAASASAPSGRMDRVVRLRFRSNLWLSLSSFELVNSRLSFMSSPIQLEIGSQLLATRGVLTDLGENLRRCSLLYHFCDFVQRPPSKLSTALPPK